LGEVGGRRLDRRRKRRGLHTSHQVWKSRKSERFARRVASAFSDWAYSAADLSASVSVGELSADATGIGRFMSLFSTSLEVVKALYSQNLSPSRLVTRRVIIVSNRKGFGLGEITRKGSTSYPQVAVRS
jgi:hypothetical protein